MSRPPIRGVTVIDLDKPFGAARGSLLRHWDALTYYQAPGAPWYEFVLSIPGIPDATYILPVDRVTAARLLIADRLTVELER